MRTFSNRLRVVLLLSAIVAAGCDKPAPAAADADTPAASTSAAMTAPTAAASAGGGDADASAPSKPTGKTVETPAGNASEVGNEIQLAGKPLYPPAECAAGGKDGCAKVKALRSTMESIKLLRHFDGPGGPKSILLFQASPAGNACNGGPLFFVRVSKDAAPVYSDVFDYCGGPDPMVGAMPDKILINIPAHPPNHGTGTLAAKTMEYDIATGTLVAAPPAPAKKKR